MRASVNVVEKAMPNVIFMKVTSDIYELPVLIADSAKELAKMDGNKSVNIRTAIRNAEKKGYKSRYVKVTLDDEEE